MYKHCIIFPEQTSIENLMVEFPHRNAILNDEEFVFVVVQNFTGEFEAAVYEFIDEPEEFDTIECRLNLVDVAGETFEYSRKAMTWCMTRY